ncbi:hypothetical protein HMPREF0063_11587 [Aeromicrobium marinum DSM 15272]|uniref:DUF3109 family protein n=1 Tax=Aeromicrobium marinum DSM 15272 TaxID=585531 RepID=E2SC28_9ACTN|nr:hypothetical protein [Aeromicrobium marinum]EFQ83314.1 hypothetical protein HMPREF0063_11587 [Aeromicrobium marinum DSM 15272]
MPEIDLGFPRSWVEFANPDDATERFRCDLTWLTSRWTCIFGAGCPGIYEGSPEAGCCTLGAHFADDDDVERVRGFVEQLTPQQWERHAEGTAHGWTETDDDGDAKTRAVDGACIFHNSREFDGGYGCALHGLALAEGLEPHTVKPDVCWQLPMRRQFREVDPGDGQTYTEVEIGEYVRSGWGPGGHDLDWYCSSNTEAHVALEPVWVAHRAELTALMGPAGYAELDRHCSAFEAAGTPVPHPASAPR